MAYDLTKTRQLVEILQTRSLTKAECGMAREQIGLYYAKKLAELQQHLFDAIEKRHTGELDPFEADEFIHWYHKQSQELHAYINTWSHSNEHLRLWLALIDEDERGIRVWQPQTRFPQKKK